MVEVKPNLNKMVLVNTRLNFVPFLPEEHFRLFLVKVFGIENNIYQTLNLPPVRGTQLDHFSYNLSSILI